MKRFIKLNIGLIFIPKDVVSFSLLRSESPIISRNLFILFFINNF